MTNHYAVIGNPIEHSKSPTIHTAFAAQTIQNMQYERILGGLDSFTSDVERFISRGGKGLNVTVPFKEQAFHLADQLSERAQLAGAVNTLVYKESRLYGDNTDGIGLVRDLTERHQFHFTNSRILLLGAGGASRGVLPTLLQSQPASITIANRTVSKAYDLADQMKQSKVAACSFAELSGKSFDLLINATAAGLQGEVPPIPPGCLAPGAWVYDMLYADQPTHFVRWGKLQGVDKALDGLGMLVEQAAESFYLWRGVRPETSAIYHRLRKNN